MEAGAWAWECAPIFQDKRVIEGRGGRGSGLSTSGLRARGTVRTACMCNATRTFKACALGVQAKRRAEFKDDSPRGTTLARGTTEEKCLSTVYRQKITSMQARTHICSMRSILPASPHMKTCIYDVGPSSHAHVVTRSEATHPCGSRKHC
jgi:hypothetical protein